MRNLAAAVAAMAMGAPRSGGGLASSSRDGRGGRLVAGQPLRIELGE